jgi:diguanylate cyclase (GGDEF)-like protein
MERQQDDGSWDMICWRPVGGDEFVIFLPGVDETNIAQLKERAAAIFDEPFRVGEQYIPLSASCGYATWPEDGNSELELFKVADRRMYERKLIKKRKNGVIG